MSSNPLYRISDDLSQLMSLIEESGGEVTPEMELHLAQLSSALVEKTDNVVEFVESRNIFIDAARAKAKQFNEIADQLEERMEKLSDYIKGCMDKLGTNKLTGGMYQISRRPPVKVLFISNENLIPVEFIKIPEPAPQVMRSEITKAIKAGNDVPGCMLVDSANVSLEFKPLKKK